MDGKQSTAEASGACRRHAGPQCRGGAKLPRAPRPPPQPAAGGRGGRFGDDERRPRRDEDQGPSRAETSDNWGADRKFAPSEDRGRGGFGGGFREREGGFREGGFRDRSRWAGAGRALCNVQRRTRGQCMAPGTVGGVSEPRSVLVEAAHSR